MEDPLDILEDDGNSVNEVSALMGGFGAGKSQRIISRNLVRAS